MYCVGILMFRYVILILYWFDYMNEYKQDLMIGNVLCTIEFVIIRFA